MHDRYLAHKRFSMNRNTICIKKFTIVWQNRIKNNEIMWNKR